MEQCFGWLKRSVILTALVAGGASASYAGPDIVKASSFGWNAEDATKCLEAAIRSGAKVVRVDKQASDWIISHPVKARSYQELIFEDGVVVQAKRGCFKGIVEGLFRVNDTTNTTFRGEGKAVLRMCMPDYLNAKEYKPAEWRHCISAMGPVNFTIRNLTLDASGGDGVYVLGCRNMLVENVIASGNNRQGISVISVDGLHVKNCIFKNTKGALPECGIDIEPHIDACEVRDVLIEDCHFIDNNCHGIAMNLSGLSSKSKDVSITIRNCTSYNNKYHGIWALLGSSRSSKGPQGTIIFDNIKVAGNGSSPLMFEGLATGSYRVFVRNCDFDGTKAKDGFQFTTGDDFGDVTFENTTLRIPDGVTPARFIGATGSGVAKLDGILTVVTPTKTTTMDLAAWGKQFVSKPELRQFRQNRAGFDIKTLTPAQPEAVIGEKEGWSPAIRGGGTQLIVKTPGPGEYKMYFRLGQVGPKWNTDGGKLYVYDAQGTTHDQVKIKPLGEITEYTLKSQGAFVFTMKAFPAPFTSFQYKSTFPGTGILCKNTINLFATKNRRLYFPVPKGSKEVKIEFSMSPNEPMTGALINPAGEVVSKVESARARAILSAEFPETTKTEIWSLRADNFVDDGGVRVGGDAIPVLSPCPKCAFTIREN